MGHPHKALTAAFVRTVKEPGKYSDGNGLMLAVAASGAKRWVQRVVINGKRSDLGLGSASLVSLSEAREAAHTNRKLARSGGDPLRQRRLAEAVPTFEIAARKVHEINLPSWRNAKHGQQFIATLETYAFPKIGDLKVDRIEPGDLLEVLLPIWLDKPETAKRVKQRLGKVFDWTVAKSWREGNPTTALDQALPKQDRHTQPRKSLPYQRVSECLEAVASSQAQPTTRLALTFLIHTATRSKEVRDATWSEIDLSEMTWTIPRDRMKQKKEHIVPLTSEMLELLGEAKHYRDASDLIFPSLQNGKAISDATLLKLVRELGFDCHIHGFRTSFKTWTQERTNVSREVSEAALAHTIQNKAEAAYARSNLLDKRRTLMEIWSRYICEKPGDIVSFGAG